MIIDKYPAMWNFSLIKLILCDVYDWSGHDSYHYHS
jgi:hypothetical protein